MRSAARPLSRGLLSLPAAFALVVAVTLFLVFVATVPLLIFWSTDTPWHGRYLSHTLIEDCAVRTQWQFSWTGRIHLVQAWRSASRVRGGPDLMVSFDLVPGRVDVDKKIVEYSIRNYNLSRQAGSVAPHRFPCMGDVLLHLVRCPASDNMVYRSVFFDGSKDLGVLKPLQGARRLAAVDDS